MAGPISDLIHRLEGELPGVRVYLDERFSAGFKDHRLELRMALHRQCGDDTVLNLSERPKLKNIFVSISHCRSLGGFVTSAKPIGFDVEETDRVPWRIIERTFHSADERGPWPAAQWTAKEAVYKGLGEKQPNVISEIAIAGWRHLSDDLYSFQSSTGHGVVTRFSNWTVAVFLGVSI